MSSSQHPIRRARARRPFLSLIAASLVGACSGYSSTAPGTPPGGPVATTSVSMHYLAFDPSAIVVAPGATVTFTNLDGINHNVTFSAASIGGSGNFSTGSAKLVMPTATGNYAYRCTLHAGMSGTVTVQ